MADATHIMQELQTCVEHELKAVTFKWLARRFSVPVNEAKQMLFAFAEKHRAKVRATYLLSGWTSEEPRRHVVHLVAPEQLSTARQALQPVTSMHVYSVQPSAPKPIPDCVLRDAKRKPSSTVNFQDSAELWNGDALQAGELFQHLFMEGEPTCLANNSWSAVLCPEAVRDPSRASKRPAPTAQEAAPSSSSGKRAAGGMTMEAKLNSVLAGGTASKRGVAAASVAVRTTSGSSEAKEAEPPAAASPAQQPAPPPRFALLAAAKTPAASRPASGKANGKTSPAGKASGAGGAQGKQVLANMWSKAAPKKEKKAAAKGSKAVPTARAHPSHSAQAAIPDNSSEEEEEAAPEEAEAAVESDEEDEMPVAKRPRSAGVQRRTILDESDEEDFEPPLAKAAPEAKTKKASGSKKSAERPPAKKKGSKTSKHSEAEMIEDDVVVDMDADEEEGAESLPVRRKTKRAEVPASKPGTVKAGDIATGKRRKVSRETYNDKGEEVTEEVWEDADVPGQGNAQAAPTPAGSSTLAATPSQPNAAAEGGAKGKQGSPAKSAAKSAPSSTKGKPASGGAKKGKNAQIAGQKGIASFFGKK